MKKLAALHNLFLQSSGVCTDTRKITKDCLFFALKGENFDGNKFADEALKNGARHVIIDDIRFHRNTGETTLCANVLTTLQKLATFHRTSLGPPILALTGSNGKTTTKELIQAVLSQRFKTVATLGNLNNHIGVPLTLLSMDSTTELGVVEMGANHLKEIDSLCEIALPDFGYITNFGKAHLEGFGSLEGVVMGKTELYRHLRAHGKLVFVNGNDPKQMKHSNGLQRVTFGNNQQDVHIELHDASGFVSVRFDKLVIQSNLIGLYNFHNIAAAVAIGHNFGVSSMEIKTAIEGYVPTNNRSQIITKGSNRIILDAYNANPSSMLAALENMLQTQGNQKTLFLGDMFELGEDAHIEHQNIVNFLQEHKLGDVYLIGENFNMTETEDLGIKKFIRFEDLESHLKDSTIEDQTILIKASRGMALERILDLI